MTLEITRDIAIKVRDTVDAGLVSGMGKPILGQMCVEAAVCYALGLPHGDDPGCVSPALRSLKITLNDSNWSGNNSRTNGLRRLALAQLGSAGHLDDKEFVRRVVDYTIRTTVPRALRIAAAASVIKDPKHKAAMIAAAAKCEKDGNRKSAVEAKDAAYAANAAYAAYAANAAAYAAYAANAAAYAANAAYAAANAANAAYAAYAANAANAAAYAAYAAAYAANAAKKRDAELSIFAEAVVQILVDMKAPGCQWLDLVEIQVAA